VLYFGRFNHIRSRISSSSLRLGASPTVVCKGCGHICESTYTYRSILCKLHATMRVMFIIKVPRCQACLFLESDCKVRCQERKKESQIAWMCTYHSAKETFFFRIVCRLFRSSGRCYGYNKEQARKQGWLLRPPTRLVRFLHLIILMTTS
jgi:hypothetical protein